MLVPRLFKGFEVKREGSFRLLRDSDIEVEEEAERLLRARLDGSAVDDDARLSEQGDAAAFHAGNSRNRDGDERRAPPLSRARLLPSQGTGANRLLR